MAIDDTELTRRDYIPIYGAYKYVRRNNLNCITGSTLLFDTVARILCRAPPHENISHYLQAKHAAERMFLLLAYNALVIDLTCNVVVDVAKTIGSGLEKLVS